MNDRRQSMVTVETTYGEVTIPLGVITPKVISTYRFGQCWALSRAIWEQTGWPMVWVYSLSHAKGKRNSTLGTKWCIKKWTERWDGRSIIEMTRTPALKGFLHGLVKTPDDNFIDIGEVAPAKRWKEMYDHLGPCALLEVPHDIMDESEFPSVKLNMEAARSYASVVLKSYVK